jgi:hypothetical protein
MNPFTTAFDMDAKLGVGDAMVRLLGALVLGAMVALVYRVTRGPSAARHALVATLVLLSVLLCLATVVIGDNVARAFSIVGALSIVRFRTVVRDTRDTAFVIAAVAVGMAAGAGYFLVPALAMPVIASAALLFAPRGERPGHEPPRRHEVTVRVAHGFADLARLESAIAAAGAGAELASITQPKGFDGIQRTWDVTLPDANAAERLATELRSVQGVSAAEIRRA